MEYGDIKIDFQVISSYDPAILMIADTSSWKHITNKPANIEITLPGSSSPIIYSFVKNQINIFNSNTLYLSCNSCEEYVDLPDGIYTINIKGSPDTFNKKRFYLKLDKTRLTLDKIYIERGIEYNLQDKNFRDLVTSIELYLKVAESHTRQGNIGKAKQFFDIAVSTIEQNLECKNCF